VIVGADIDPVAAKRRVGAKLAARIDRARLVRRTRLADADRVRPEVAGLEHGHVGVLGLVDRAVVLRVGHRQEQLVVVAIAAEPMPKAAHRQLLRIRLRGARRDERIALVARPCERIEAGDHRSDLFTRRAVENAEILALGALRVHTHGDARRLAVRNHGADARLARRIEHDGIEQQHVAAVDARVERRLRPAARRALEEFAAVLEERRLGPIAVEIAPEFLLHTGNRRRMGIEEAQRRRVLVARPRRDRRILAVLEPPIPVGQRGAVQDIDDGAHRRFRRKERRIVGVHGERHRDEQEEQAGRDPADPHRLQCARCSAPVARASSMSTASRSGTSASSTRHTTSTIGMSTP
jgi:hypothetical protein